MSRKIYNGFYIKGNPDIRTLNQYFVDLRKNIQEIGNKKLQEYYLITYCKYLDLLEVNRTVADNYYQSFCKVNKLETNKNIIKLDFQISISKIVEDAINSEKRSPYDLGCHIQIIPIQDKILGLYYTQQAEYEQIIITQPWFEDYHYQNQVDKPDDITEEEWEQRDSDWKEVFQESTISNSQGFSVDLFNINKAPITYPLNLSMIPSKEVRAKLVAELVYQYDKFDGSDYSVFFTKEYSDFMKEKTQLIIPKLKDDPFKE